MTKAKTTKSTRSQATKSKAGATRTKTLARIKTGLRAGQKLCKG